MRGVICFVACICLIVPASGQKHEIGVKFNPGLSFRIFKSDPSIPQGIYSDYFIKPSFSAGLTYRRQLNKHLYLQSGLSWLNVGEQVSFPTWYNVMPPAPSDPTSVNVRYNYNYLSLETSLRGKFGSTERSAWYGFLGMEHLFFISPIQKTTYFYQDGTSNVRKRREQPLFTTFRVYIPAVTAGFGYEFKLFRDFRAHSGLCYTQLLTNTVHDRFQRRYYWLAAIDVGVSKRF